MTPDRHTPAAVRSVPTNAPARRNTPSIATMPGATLMAAMLLAASPAGCRREAPQRDLAGAAEPAVPATTAPAPAAEARLADVSERDARHVIGISYPPAVNDYPGLAAELKKYADAARAELQQALDGLGAEPPRAPYELSLSFTMLVETPRIVAVAADGSSYTGGAHGNPLIARFVWLPQRNELLTARRLVPEPAAWQAISEYARERLHAALWQRIEAAELEPAQRAEMLRSAGRMIDEGTQPRADDFAQFEPVLDPDGRIRALRFVFPPYQVGPYVDGAQSVEVPADVLLPRVAPEYRDLFAPAPARPNAGDAGRPATG